MKITVLGAAGGEVTGSSYLVQTDRASVLVDAGLFQGGARAEGLNQSPVTARQPLDAVLLTHGHLDHTGRLPLVTQGGRRVPILATPATIELTALILRDSARIQAADAERRNRKRERAGQEPQPPLYTPEQVEDTIRLLRPVAYQTPVPVAPGLQVIWAESGHMLGSTSLQLIATEDGREKRVVFSGDLGPRCAPILREFEPFQRADLVFLESTYGDRDHRPFGETVEQFLAVIREALAGGGKILVPTFAVGRAQLLVTLLAGFFRKHQIEPFPVFLDSPMAIEASAIYSRHPELFDDDMRQFMREGSIERDLATLRPSVTADDSKRINDLAGSCLVLAGAGMCNAGRILHHLKQHLWKRETHVVIVGYQSRESLGRRLVEGDQHVTIHGEKVVVKARIHTLGGFSAHAGQTDLLEWLAPIAPCRPRVVLTHGEEPPRTALATAVQQRFGLPSVRPALQEVIEV